MTISRLDAARAQIDRQLVARLPFVHGARFDGRREINGLVEISQSLIDRVRERVHDGRLLIAGHDQATRPRIVASRAAAPESTRRAWAMRWAAPPRRRCPIAAPARAQSFRFRWRAAASDDRPSRRCWWAWPPRRTAGSSCLGRLRTRGFAQTRARNARTPARCTENRRRA